MPKKIKMGHLSPTGRFTVCQPDWQWLPLSPGAKAVREALRSPEERAERERLRASWSQVDYVSIEQYLLKLYQGL